MYNFYRIEYTALNICISSIFIIAISKLLVNGKTIAIFQPDGEFSTFTYLRKDVTKAFSAYSICMWITLYRFRGDSNVPFCYGNEYSPDLLYIGKFFTYSVHLISLIQIAFSALLYDYSEFRRSRQFVRMCQRTDKRNCVETAFSSNELRIWNHFCFTGGHANVDEGRAANFTLRGYLNGVLFDTSKSNYSICLTECNHSHT